MKKQEMKFLIVQSLSDLFAGTGFRVKKSDASFTNHFPGGWQRIVVPLYDYHPEFVFSLNFCIRLDSVEEIVNKFSAVIPGGEKGTTTMISALDYFMPMDHALPKGIRVSSKDDVAAAVETIGVVMQKKVLPYLDTHKDVASLNRSVNHDDPGIDITQYPWKAMASVTLARLAGDPEFANIVVHHRTAMELDPAADHQFNRLIKYLEHL